MDEQALATSMQHLTAVAEKIDCIQGNALTSLKKVAALGPFDLVLCGGLFDYLSDKQIQFLIEKSNAWLLKPRSVFFFTNIAEGNPFKTMIEHFGAWYLKERSVEDIERLVGVIPEHQRQLHVSRDSSGLAYLAELRIDRGSAPDHESSIGAS